MDCVGKAAHSTRRGTTVAGAEVGGRPVVVPTLVALNLAVFVWTVVQARSLLNNDASELYDAWTLTPVLVADGEWWRLLTAGFLHYGPIHIAFNMLALWVLGRDMETVLGRGRFLAVYAISLLGSSAAVMLLAAPEGSVAGASGAVFGLMGGLAVVLRRMRVPAGQVIGLIVVNVVISFVFIQFLSVQGHIGGLVVGAAATAGLVYAPTQNRNAVQAGALVGLTVLLVAAIAVRASVL